MQDAAVVNIHTSCFGLHIFVIYSHCPWFFIVISSEPRVISRYFIIAPNTEIFIVASTYNILKPEKIRYQYITIKKVCEVFSILYQVYEVFSILLLHTAYIKQVKVSLYAIQFNVSC